MRVAGTTTVRNKHKEFAGNKWQHRFTDGKCEHLNTRGLLSLLAIDDVTEVFLHNNDKYEADGSLCLCAGVQPEQHLQSGLRQKPAAQLQARRSHGAPGDVPLHAVWGHPVVPFSPRQLRYVTEMWLIFIRAGRNVRLMETVLWLADHSTPASQSPHSSNPSSLPSSPPTHNHGAMPFSNFGPIGTPDNRDRRGMDCWKASKSGEPGKCSC